MDLDAWGSIPWVRGLVNEEAVQLWHEYRTPFLLTAFAVLILLRVYLHTQEQRGELLVFPKIYGTNATQEDVKSEKKPVSEPEAAKASVASGPRRIKGSRSKPSGSQLIAKEGSTRIQIAVFYSSITGTTEKRTQDYVQRLDAALAEITTPLELSFLKTKLLNLAEVDYDDYFLNKPTLSNEGGENVEWFYLFLIPSFNIDTINDTFLEHLQETHHDFRIDTAPLTSLLGYSVFGFGDKEGWPTEEEGFCFQATAVDKWMAKLTGRKRAYPIGMGDWKRDGAARLDEWHLGLVEVLDLLARTGSLGDGVAGSGDAEESDGEADAEDDGEVLFDESAETKPLRRKNSGSLGDLEDLGRIMESARGDGEDVNSRPKGAPIAVDFTTYGKTKPRKTASAPAKEMVPKSSPTYAALTKQGYSIVGSHSGVKICRWTKSALRGRGSCYKFSFYGIHSHQCMETTPSLSCSNKCVFCWRHGTNPVGTTWRWVVDPPQLIFDGVKENHYKKIKMMRGVPGVRAERFAEAMRIRHCALSLVGEPIFYPHINEFLTMLHRERISSFLVCNAQHPDQLAALNHVTQLYVSIDASNRESLRRIDRPLHRDFWERFQRCLDILRERRFQQRTVFRLTLVKGFNIEDEVEGYADLVEKGLPCFVEIKGVTYCGTSTAGNAGLTMGNVPFYEEVCEFVTALNDALAKRGLGYGIAAEHAHSCCILMASERFRVNGKWHTIIDYDRFFELLEEKGPDGDFSPEDYMGPETPEWATWGNGGFDPRDTKVDRKGRPIATS
ncbi:hypothetical protein GQ53DRAFT_839777 [Thozetella sp. PMI_491]|nr:hypothetical protein GQ53DRAFT_839777 [Thozetella sp. PMI_491]